VSNPFDEKDANFVVLVNDEEQYSLWPVSVDVPAGWKVVLKECPRQGCLDFIEANWLDMRPRSLRDAMGEQSDR
jgi:uncharacterized protein YbdZ (MbtH family)